MNVVVVQPDGVLVSAILDVVSKDRRARSVEVVGRVKTFDQVCSSEFFPPVDTAPDEKPANTEATKAAGVFSIFLQDSVTVDAEGGVSAEDAAIGNFGYEFWWTSGHIFSVLCHSPFLFLSDASTCAYPPSLHPSLPPYPSPALCTICLPDKSCYVWSSSLRILGHGCPIYLLDQLGLLFMLTL